MQIGDFKNTAIGDIRNTANRVYHEIFHVPNALTEDEQLIMSLNKAYENLMLAESKFNEITDGAMIDCISYDILAARAKYSYLLKQAKEKNLHW